MAASLAFDHHIFAGRRPRPVHARQTTEGWISTGIAFEDFTRFSTHSHKQSSERRLPTPDWAINTEQLRELLVVHLEQRAYLPHPQPGTQEERLARAVEKLKSDAPKKLAAMKKLCQEYVSLKGSSPNDPRLHVLEGEIENLDTQLRHINRPAELLIGIVYHYFRACLDSVGTGQALGIKPPSVRQTLWRLHRTWARMQAGTLRQRATSKNAQPPAPRQRQPGLKRRSRFDQERERICELYKIGTSVPNISRVVGCSYPTVQNLLKREGIYDCGPARRKLEKAHKEDIQIATRRAARVRNLEKARAARRFKYQIDINHDRVVSLYQEEGRSVSEIARELGFPEGTGYNRVCAVLKKAGVYRARFVRRKDVPA